VTRLIGTALLSRSWQRPPAHHQAHTGQSAPPPLTGSTRIDEQFSFHSATRAPRQRRSLTAAQSLGRYLQRQDDP